MTGLAKTWDDWVTKETGGDWISQDLGWLGYQGDWG